MAFAQAKSECSRTKAGAQFGRTQLGTIAPLEAFEGKPDISAQSRYLKKYFKIDPAPGK
ncbi:MAG: hypothetical protein J0H65_11880 [Rhizobiales bacterium]|nr:hypothetical protein [Hyphomicrobiales bacterium]